jgi:hypothetical protein
LRFRNSASSSAVAGRNCPVARNSRSIASRSAGLFVCPDCAKGTPTRRHVWSKSWQPAWGTGQMTYYYDAATAELEHQFERLRFERLRSKRQGYSKRSNRDHEMTPAIKMVIGDWYVDELGVRTREITARE